MRARARRHTFVAAASLLTLLASGSVTAAGGPIDQPPVTTDVTATTENAFYPDDTSVNLTACISALPRPDCGSKERGGWRQAAVFGAVVAGLAAVGTRLVIGIRRRDRADQTDVRDA
jgi:hypothetical protein